MKVILLKDIKNFGKKWDVKHVADGHARNFLLPQGLVKPASEDALRELEALRKQEELKATVDLERVETTANMLEGYELTIKSRVGEGGTLYASVNQEVISKKLKDLGFLVAEKSIKLKEPIKELGEYTVPLEFDHSLEVEIKVIITAEE